MSEELKPCPFCGGEAEYEGLYCYCTRCGCRMEDDPDEAEAIAAWNRRASPTPPTTEGRENGHLLWRLRHNDTAKHLCGLAADEIERLSALLSSPRVEDVRREALEEAARVAEKLAAELARLKGSGDRRVQIGSHLETCATIAASIRSLSLPDGEGDKQACSPSALSAPASTFNDSTTK